MPNTRGLAELEQLSLYQTIVRSVIFSKLEHGRTARQNGSQWCHEVHSRTSSNYGPKVNSEKNPQDQSPAVNPANSNERQVLTMLGNRMVVFGHQEGAPSALAFTPEIDTAHLPRVGSVYDNTEERITQTLRVSGLAVEQLAPTHVADVVLTSSSGERVLVEVKVRDSEPDRRELEIARHWLAQASREGQDIEIWYFSRERPRLDLVALRSGELVVEKLMPLAVWEETTDGYFTRANVQQRVTDWEQRVTHLYSEVKRWLERQPTLRAEETRTMIMSEELMQEFAVADVNLPILDILQGRQPIASFVPRALWVIGSNGRVDLITRTETYFVVDSGTPPSWGWRLVNKINRQRDMPFEEDALLSVIGAV